MRALSVKQPWPELIARGMKGAEVRSWRTDYRGSLLICSTARPSTSDDARGAATLIPFKLGDMPCGVAVCVVDLVGIHPGSEWMHMQNTVGFSCCHFAPTDWLWILERPRRVAPVPVRGRLSLFSVDDSLVTIAAPSQEGHDHG